MDPVFNQVEIDGHICMQISKEKDLPSPWRCSQPFHRRTKEGEKRYRYVLQIVFTTNMLCLWKVTLT